MTNLKKKENISNHDKKNNIFTRFLNLLERAGNKLPEPMMIFVGLAVGTVLISFIASMAGLTTVHPVSKETITVVNLLSKEGIQRMLSNVVKNFTTYRPLGVVLIAMLGVGVADKAGFFSALLRKTMTNVKGSRVVLFVIFISIMSNAAGDTGFVLMPPLGGMLFAAAGMHPVAGMLAAYAGVAGGFSANLIVGATDVLCVSFTQAAASLLDPDMVVSPASNWYFLVVSTLLLSLIATWVTVKIVNPRLSNLGDGTYKGEKIEAITEQNIKGLKAAGIAALLFLILILVGAVPENGLLRDPHTGSLLSHHAPLMQGLIVLISSLFFITGSVYGKVSGSIKNSRDLSKLLGQTMADMGPYIALVFISAQFINYFNWSNLGIILASSGAGFLQNLGIARPLLLITFILVVGLINMMMGSMTAKWAILGPIFVPMFMLLDIHPAATQMAYRIGDSITNCITPWSAYLVIILAFAKKYDEKAGLGTLIASLIPYSTAFLLMWIVQLMVWYFLKLPLGPGSPMFM